MKLARRTRKSPTTTVKDFTEGRGVAAVLDMVGGDYFAKGLDVLKIGGRIVFIAALGGKDNIMDVDNCATRLRMEIADTSKVDEHALKRAGAGGPGPQGDFAFARETAEENGDVSGQG